MIVSGENLTVGDMYDMGLLLNYFEASCLLHVGKSQISNLVKEKRLEQVVYRKKKYITLMSALVYKGDVKKGDVLCFYQRVDKEPPNYKERIKRKEIRMVEKKEWHEIWNKIDEQIKDL
jgi:hypothetical protein